MRRTVVLAVLSAAFAVMVAVGIRASFGLFLGPITETLGTGRETVSLAIAISNIIYGLPLVGLLSDRFGPRRVIVIGGALWIVGLWAMTRIATAAGLYLTFGVLVGLALSATTYVVVLGAIAQLVPPERRSQAFGIVTAAGSSGMFVVPPITQFLLAQYGWQTTALLMAGISSIILFLAFGLPDGAQPRSADGSAAAEEPFIQVLNRARRNGSYWLLVAGFFVCGFHVAFIGTHLPSYLSDNGLSDAVGAGALSLIGAFNIVGSYTFGWLGDRWRKKYLLSFLYLSRAVVMGLFLIMPLTQAGAFIFAGTIGFLWLATVPLTSGTVAQIFGTRYLSTLYGFVFLSHQIGAFLGVWLGGRAFDVLGTYDPIWYTAIALGVIGALVHTPISDRPQMATAPA